MRCVFLRETSMTRFHTIVFNRTFWLADIISSCLYTFNADEMDTLAGITNTMHHYEKVATATKSNARYQSYIISVFKGADLQKLGIKDLEEALSLALGVDIVVDNVNTRTMVFLSFEILSVVTYDNRSLSRNGDAPLWFKNWNLGITLDYKEFYLKARHNSYTHGSAYGINWLLPDKNDGWGHKARLGPDGTVFSEGLYRRHYAKQRTYYSSEFIRYSGWENHRFTIGHRYFKEETYDTVTQLTNWAIGVELADYSDTMPFFDKEF